MHVLSVTLRPPPALDDPEMPELRAMLQRVVDALDDARSWALEQDGAGHAWCARTRINEVQLELSLVPTEESAGHDWELHIASMRATHATRIARATQLYGFGAIANSGALAVVAGEAAGSMPVGVGVFFAASVGLIGAGLFGLTRYLRLSTSNEEVQVAVDLRARLAQLDWIEVQPSSRAQDGVI